jgi:ergothioneine biosynthesis protein EgtB
MTTVATSLNREALADWYRRNRQRSRHLFDIVRPEAYYSQPIALRHPIVFYEGHLPAFSLNTLVKKGLGRPGVDERLERLFARGIDPEDQESANRSQRAEWPSRDEVQRFAAECDRLILDALANAPIDQPGHPLLHEGEAVYAILEHEAMHQETMLYMWHQLPFEHKQAPAGIHADAAGTPPAPSKVTIPAGRATLGAQRGEIPFGWDNEFSAMTVDVPAFAVGSHDVTNEEFMNFVDAGGYQQAEWWTPASFEWVREEAIEHPRFWTRREGGWMWRGMFDEIALPRGWPVYVSQAEAAAYARWTGARLMTEAEYQRAAFAEPSGHERPYPWGDSPPDPSRGLFDFRSWAPTTVGAHPAGRSAWGVHDLMGNGWEWTSTEFAPLDGFRPMASYPEYSADFFDGQHVVMKGASPATAVELLRRSFRNWFRPNYPFVYATFRCVWPVE